MKRELVNPSNEELCDLMCGKPEDDMICGYCLHHRKENEEWICKNPDSECFGCYTEYRDSCEDFEDRANSGFSVSILNKKKV